MSAKLAQTSLALAAIALLFGLSIGYAKTMYRWVDDDGNTHFSDQVPPEHIKHRRETLSEKGRVIAVTEKAKTQEQLELEKRLARLRKAQEEIIAKQKAADKVLLSSFRNLDDLLLTIETKNQALEAQIKATESNLTRLQEQLASQQKKAAGFERNAKKVPQTLLNDINSTLNQIKETESTIATQREKQSQIKRQDDADIERYRSLVQDNTGNQPQPDKIPSLKDANELGLFYCENDHLCSKAWEIARRFVNFHSTTGSDIDSDDLIMSKPPAKDTDLSLSVSKLTINNDQYQLFLDIRCRDSASGQALCLSAKVNDIRSSFRAYINAALSGAPEQ